MHQRLVGELSLVSIEVLVPADDCLGTEFHMEIFLARVGCEANDIDPGLNAASRVPSDHKNLLVDVSTLLKNVLARIVQTRLKSLQKAQHEVRIVLVLPLVVLRQTVLRLLRFGLPE